MNQIDVFSKALELLETKGWTQGAGARDKNGNYVASFYQGAASFCSYGALQRSVCDSNQPFRVFDDSLFLLAEKINGSILEDDLPIDIVTKWNDSPSQTKEDVVAMFKQIIEELKDV